LYHLVARAPAYVGDLARQPGRFAYADEIGAEASGADDPAAYCGQKAKAFHQQAEG